MSNADDIIEGEVIGDLARIEDDPSPTPPPRVQWVREVGRQMLAGLARGTTDAAFRIAGTVVEHPYRVSAGAVVLAGATPVTSGEITAATIGLASLLVCSPATRSRLLSLAQANKYRQRKSRIRRQWVTTARHANLARKAEADHRYTVPRLAEFEPTAVGVRFAADGGNVGAGLSKFRAGADAIRASLKAWDVDITPHPRKPSRVIINAIYEDPFAETISVATLSRPSRHLYVVTGRDAHGVAVEKDVRLPHLIAGMQGAGKSSEIWTLLYGLVAAGIPFRLRIFDPKGGQEFVDFEEFAYVYERNPNNWPQFLENAFASMNFQRERLRKRGLRKSDFTIENPLDVMIIDELLTVIALNSRRKTIIMDGAEVALPDAWMVYLSSARSAGHTVFACSQLTQKATLGDARDLFGYTTLLRVESDDAVRAVGFDPALYPAHELPRSEETAGIGYMKTERGGIKYRSAYLTDEERAALAVTIGKSQDYYRARKEAARERAQQTPPRRRAPRKAAK